MERINHTISRFRGATAPAGPWLVDGNAYLAHEINQPLTAIQLNAETALDWLAQDPPDIEAARQAVGRIVGNGDRAIEIVGSIGDLLRDDAPAFSDVDVHRVIADVLGVTRPRCSAHSVVVVTEFAAGLSPVRGHRGQLERVVTNLVVNALDAMAHVHERTLHIRTRAVEEGHALVTVEDSGTGLDDDALARAFDPHFTTKADGMGLGLTLCRSIVTAHGGRLWAGRRQPCGSVFSFVVPTRSHWS